MVDLFDFAFLDIGDPDSRFRFYKKYHLLKEEPLSFSEKEK